MSDSFSEDARLIEALLFASPEPVSRKLLADRLGTETGLDAMLDELKQFYAQRGVNLVEINGVYSFRTAPDLADKLSIVVEPKRKLPRAAAETMAIIAYHQPVTRAEIEAIRGVATSTGTLDLLLERGWVRPGKRRETPGRPVTWVTTQDFLSYFNLTSLADLPGLEELKASGLLDTRPVLATMPSPAEDSTLPDAVEGEEEPAHWIAEDDAAAHAA